MGLLSKEDKEYLKNEFDKIKKDVSILFVTTDDEKKCEQCDNVRQIIDELTALSKSISFREIDINSEELKQYSVEMAPAMVLLNNGNGNIKYYGVPSGYEFSSLIDDIVDLGTGEIELDDEVRSELEGIEDKIHIRVFVTPTCPYCPAAVRIAHKFAMINPNIKADMIESYEFTEMADKYKVQGVPRVVINETVSFEGALPENEYLVKIKESL
ncbi:MAG: thioredoxin family protein [candidate division WOR-3 bacterium]|nr:thioredoxin family protein [candidate division WOR-3 bacterium]